MSEDNLPLFPRNPVTRPASVQGIQQLALNPFSILQDIEKRAGTSKYMPVDDEHYENPEFRQHKEATNSELFYDLFFVANLTVFSYIHDVNDTTTLTQFIGFFCILWFTWYNVALYDVRFAMDSVIERAFKFLHFGFMIGFAAVGPRFKVAASETDEHASNYYNSLTLMLAASRFTLVIQYLQTAWFVRHSKNTKAPLCLTAGSYFTAGLIYLVVWWNFPKWQGAENPLDPLHSQRVDDPHLQDMDDPLTITSIAVTKSDYTYIAWYIVAVVETLAAIAISMIWRKTVGFKGTHIVQRMSLLTLIILGEGLIGIAKHTQILSSYAIFSFEISNVASLVSAVLIFYFIYMLYFDWMDEDHFGSIRQQIWSFLHFPFHFALVLTIEGVNQSIMWRAAMVAAGKLYTIYEKQDFDAPRAAIAKTWDYTASSIMRESLSASKGLAATLDGLQTKSFIDICVNDIRNGTDPDLIRVNVDRLWSISNTAIFNTAGFGGQKNLTEVLSKSGRAVTIQDVEKKDYKSNATIKLAYIYLFVAVGCVVLLCTLLATLGKRHKKQTHHWIKLQISAVIGLVLCLLSLMVLAAGKTAREYGFVSSGWVLPTIAILLFCAAALNNIKPTFLVPAGHNDEQSPDMEMKSRRHHGQEPSRRYKSVSRH